MDYINSILSQSNQKVQLVAEAIPTLCDRLQHASLSSDRRSAVLGLKSFSRQYRESVVEHGLRPLILTLSKDLENSSVLKPLLECLLILFIRGEGDEDVTRGFISQQSRIQNGKYPSPLLLEDMSIDQLSLWIADELTKDDQSLNVLLDIMANESNYHVRLYAIQLVESLVSTRPVKVKDCILNIPTGISVIVSLLRDPNDPIRNEAILLLMSLANNNFNIQKLVAFENTFDTLFDIIDEEGGIRGSILIQDCLTLIQNLLSYNASNQKFFLETQCVPRLAKLLSEPLEVEANDILPEDGGDVELLPPPPPIVWSEQRIQNITIALDICRTFVSEDNDDLAYHQSKLYKTDVLSIVLRLVFHPETLNDIRVSALLTASDIIRGNNIIQLSFSTIDIPYIDPSLPTQIQAYDQPISIPLALLNWALFINSVHSFSLRASAVYCLRSYFRGNKDAQMAFLQDQINAYLDPHFYDRDHPLNGEANGSHQNGNAAVATPHANIFSTLMDYNSQINLNPYQVWFANVILMYSFDDNEECKELAHNVKTGDESLGEEVMTCIQAISGLLAATLENADPRIAIGYMMLLSCSMYEDTKVVDEFLSDSSVVHSILAFLTNNTSESTQIARGAAIVTLGIAYEFSTKNSPIPRLELHTLLVKSLGKDNYALKVKQFRDLAAFKSFQEDDCLTFDQDETGLPNVYFDLLYVNLIKENFSRIRRALFHDPNFEPQVKISFDAFEELDLKYNNLVKDFDKEKSINEEAKTELQQEIDRLKEDCEKLENDLSEALEKFSDIQEKNKITVSELETSLTKLKELSDNKLNLEKVSSKSSKELEEAHKKIAAFEDSIKSLEHKLGIEQESRKKAEEGINKMSRELLHLTKGKKESDSTVTQLQKQIDSLKSQATKVANNSETQIKSLQADNQGLRERIKGLEKSFTDSNAEADRKLKELIEKVLDTEDNNEHLMDKLRSAASAFQEIKASKARLEEELQGLKEEQNSKSTTLATKEREVAEFKNTIDTLSKELNESRIAHLAELELAKADVRDIASSRDSLIKEKDGLLQELKTSEQKLTFFEDELEKTKTEYETQIEQLKVSNDEMTARITELESEVDNFKNKHKEVTEELSMAELKYASIKSQSQRALEEKVDELTSLKQKQQRELEELMAAHSTKLEQLSKEHTDQLDSAKLDHQVRLAEAVASHEQEVASLKKEHIDAVEDLKNEHEKTIQQLKDLESEDRESQIAKHAAMVEQVEQAKQTELSELSLEMGKLREELKSVNKVRESAEQELKKLSTELTNSEARASEKESLLNKLQNKMQNMAEEREAIVSGNKAKVDKLAKEIEASKQSYEGLKEELQRKTLEIKKLSEETNQRKQKIDALNDLILKNEKDLFDLQKKYENVSKELADGKESAIALLASLSELKINRSSLETQIKNQSYTLEKLTTEKVGLESDLKQQSEKLEAEKTAKDATLEKLIGLEKKLTESHDELNSLKTKTSREIQALKEELKKERDNVERLKKDLKSKEEEIESERQMRSKNSETIVQEYTEKISRLEKSLSDLKLNHESETTLFESEKLTLSGSLQALRDEFDLFKKQAEESQLELKKAIDHSTSKVEALNADKEIEIGKLKELHEKALRGKQMELDTLEAKLENNKSQLEILQSEITNKNQEIEQFKKELDIEKLLKSDCVGELTLKVSQLTKDNESLEKKEEMMTRKLEEADANLKSKKAEYETLLKGNEAIISELELEKKEVSTVNDKSKTLVNEISTLKANIEQLEKLKTEHESEVKRLEATSGKTLSELETLKIQKLELEKKLKDLNESLASTQKSLNDGQLELTRAKKEAEDFKLQLEELKKIGEKLKKLTEELAQVQIQVEKKDKTIEELAASLTSTTDGYEEQLKNLRDQVDKQDSDANQKVTSLEKDVQAGEKKIEELKDQVKTAEKTKSDLADQVKQSEKKSEDLESQIQAANKKLNDLQDQLTESERKAKVLQSEIQNFETSTEALKMELVTNQKDKFDLEKQLKTAKSNVSEVQVQLDESKKESELLKAQVSKSADTSEIDKLKDELTRLKKKLDNSAPKSELEDLMLLLSEMEESKEKYKQELKKRGGEVSEDDEDDEDDDEDDDE